MVMRLRLIACEVFARQVYYAAALSPHVVDIELVDKGLHTRPEVLRAELQQRLERIPESRYAAILLAYGLCSNSTVGLFCPHTRLVIPRAHDCITLYLGSRERYASEFQKNPGTYWYTADYIERGEESEGEWTPLGASEEALEASRLYQEYVEKYGRDNADYLMEVMGAWKRHYSRAAYIDIPEIPLPDYAPQVKELARRRGWCFERLEGSMSLIRDLIFGHWDEERFLIVPPGQRITPTYNGEIVSTEPA